MGTWRELTESAPELAGKVEARFGSNAHGVLATLRQDGAPRLSGIEPLFLAGELWLGSMPNARKSQDLRRDPRFALHTVIRAETLESGESGDAKLRGRALEATDEATRTAYLKALKERNGYEPPGLDFDLFRAEIDEAVTISIENNEMVIETWRPGQPVHRQTRT